MPRYADDELFPGLNIPARNKLDLDTHAGRRSAALSVITYSLPLISMIPSFLQNLEASPMPVDALTTALLFTAGELIGNRNIRKHALGIALGVATSLTLYNGSLNSEAFTYLLPPLGYTIGAFDSTFLNSWGYKLAGGLILNKTYNFITNRITKWKENQNH